MADEIKKTEGEVPQPEQTPDAQSAQPEQKSEQQPEVTIDLSALAEGLKAQLEAAEKKEAEAKDTLLRTMAEYDNFRKRSAREQAASYSSGMSFAIEKLLPVLDTLEMAANAPTEDENYKKGVVMTLDKCAEVFKAMGVEEIPALGLPFDPAVHAAVMQQPGGDAASGTVLQVFQKGYRLNGKVIRCASVIVAE